MLATLKWRLSSCPTALEFLDVFLSDPIFNGQNEFVHKMATFLATMCLHHIQFCTRDASMIAAASICVAVRIKDSPKSGDIRGRLSTLAACDQTELSSLCKMVSFLARNLDSQLAGLRKARAAFTPLLG